MREQENVENREQRTGESVQKLALRLCTKQWNLDYDTLLSICNLPTLTARRKFFCLCTMFKIINNNMVHFPHNVFVPRVTPLHPASDLLFPQPFAHTNSFLYSFVPFMCRVWNSLPLSIRLSDSISSFKYSVIDWLYHN